MIIESVDADLLSSGIPAFWDIYWPTLFLVILGAIGAVIAIRTLQRIERQTKATEVAADAAKVNAEAIVNSERARIVAELPPHPSKNAYLLKITNVGRTPAHILNFEMRYSCLPEGVTDLPDNAGDVIEFHEFNRLLAAGEGITVHGPFDIGQYMKESWKEICELKKTAVFHGCVNYRHIFSTTEECKSAYCYAYTVSLSRLSSVGRHTHYR